MTAKTTATLTAKEIAEQLGLPESTVHWRIWYLRHNGEAKISKPFDQTTLELVRDFRTYKSGQKKKAEAKAEAGVSVNPGRFQQLLLQNGIVVLDDALAKSLGYKNSKSLYQRLHYAENLLGRCITDPAEFRDYVLAGKDSAKYKALKDQKLQSQQDLPVRGLKLQHLENLINSLNAKESKEWQELRKECHCSYKSPRVNYVIAVLEYSLAQKWIDSEQYWKMRDLTEVRELKSRKPNRKPKSADV
jgi:hypothetical protein